LKSLLAALHALLFNSETVDARYRVLSPTPLSLSQLFSALVSDPQPSVVIGAATT
jgi:hypothetical protein